MDRPEPGAAQAEAWSRSAKDYERDFVDPHRPDVSNPVRRWLERLPDKKRMAVADLGCGNGPLLPLLSEQFHTVYAVDFAEGMLARAREQHTGLKNVEFILASLLDLSKWEDKIDVALAINSIVMPDVRDQEKALRQVRRCLRPGGWFAGILPAMDAIHYYTMLLVDRGFESGKPLDAARKNAAYHAEHVYLDFAFGQFRYQGLEQHFWQPFEIPYRFRRAGFRRVQVRKVHLAWEQFARHQDMKRYPPTWDWGFLTRR